MFTPLCRGEDFEHVDCFACFGCGSPYAIRIELKYFYLFVFCFGGILFVSCVTVCGCGWGGGGGELKSWDGWGFVVLKGRRMDVCVMGICGESQDVYVVFGQ